MHNIAVLLQQMLLLRQLQYNRPQLLTVQAEEPLTLLLQLAVLMFSKPADCQQPILISDYIQTEQAELY
jgi:hypothetical protein